MIVDEKEILNFLRSEAKGISADVNASYREKLLGAAELIELHADVIAALRERDAEMLELLNQAGQEIQRDNAILRRQTDLVAECSAGAGTDLGKLDELAEALERNVIRQALLCGAMRVEREPDLLHRGTRMRVRLSVVGSE